jgi:hypothetical protein
MMVVEKRDITGRQFNCVFRGCFRVLEMLHLSEFFKFGFFLKKLA